MMTPDDFLDWLEDKRVERNDDSGLVVDGLIQDFNREFDTRDSPVAEPEPTRRKKKPRPAVPPGNQQGQGPEGEVLA